MARLKTWWHTSRILDTRRLDPGDRALKEKETNGRSCWIIPGADCMNTTVQTVNDSIKRTDLKGPYSVPLKYNGDKYYEGLMSPSGSSLV